MRDFASQLPLRQLQIKCDESMALDSLQGLFILDRKKDQKERLAERNLSIGSSGSR